MNIHLKIGELARRTRCPADSIRFYEREGLLPQPARTAGNYRVYGPAHVERLSFIRNCRLLDMSLDEIRQLLRVRDDPQGNCVAAHTLLDEHIAHVAARINELQRLERELKALRRACRSAHRQAQCAILSELGGEGAANSAQPNAGRPKAGGPNSGAQLPPHVRGSHRR